jgi:hypothetical protein
MKEGEWWSTFAGASLTDRVEWVTNVRMLAHLRFLLFGLQEQDKSHPMLGDPRRCKAGTHAVDEEGLP